MIRSELTRYLFLIVLSAALTACGSSSTDEDADVFEIDETGTTATENTEFDSTAPLLRARQAAQDIAPGDSFVIEFDSDNFPVNQGGGVTIRYDAKIIRVDSVTLAPEWNFAVLPGQIDNDAGEVRDILFASFEHPGGPFGILQLNATALAKGKSSVLIVESEKNPFVGDGRRFDVQFVGGLIEVN